MIILEKEKFSIETIERKNIYLLNTKFMLMRLGKEEIYLYVIKIDNGKSNNDNSFNFLIINHLKKSIILILYNNC